MSMEWIRFAIVAVLMLGGMIFFTAAVMGAKRFGYAMNRLHAAGIGDTAGLLFVVASLFVAVGIHTDTIKLALIVFFMFFTSPVSSHFLCQIEYYTNPTLYQFTGMKPGGNEDRQQKERSVQTKEEA